MNDATVDVLCEVRGEVGFISLNRPQALNALTLPMIRALTVCLQSWRDDERIQVVAMRGSNKAGPFGAFALAATSAFSTRPCCRATRHQKTFLPRNTPSTT